ncbi:amidohydrolase family protein [Halobacterium sp. MBLA0001]|uniref:amidohydrolase family protein n=1 Tax=Halobacterium sp. MBLA0001 TaxID=3413511 RepID=UPI003C72660F
MLYFSTQPIGLTEKPHSRRREGYASRVVDMIGAENLMFATDLPHPDFDTPEELYRRISGQLDDSEVREIMGGNVVDVFGFDVTES